MSSKAIGEISAIPPIVNELIQDNQPPLPSKPGIEPDVELETEPLTKHDDRRKTKPLFFPDGVESSSEPVNEPDESTSYILDDLITTIDQEIEYIFGAGLIADLGAEASVSCRKNEEQFVIFTLAGVAYAHEVGEIINLTPIPKVPAWQSEAHPCPPAH